MAGKTGVPMMGREEFNRVSGAMFNNSYGEDSRAVLLQELELAQQRGDPRAERSARAGLARVEAETGKMTPVVQGSTMATTDDTGSPIPQARFGLDALVGDTANVISAITAGNVLRSSAAESSAQVTLAAGEATAQATTSQAESVLAQDQAVLGFLRTIGMDINDPDSALRGELAAQANMRSARMKVDNEIVQLEQINFFQDPLNFLMAQPKLQQLTAQYNQLARQENESDAEVARMQSISDTVIRNQPSRNAALVRQTAQATALAQVKVAQATAEQATAANSAANAKMLLDTLALKQHVFANVLGVESLEEQIRDRRQKQADTNWYREQALAAAEEKAEAKRRDTEQEMAIVTGMNLHRQAINGAAVPAFTKQDVRSMSPQQRAAWYEVTLRGSYGQKYSQSLPFISTYGNPVGAANGGNPEFMTNVRNTEIRIGKKATAIETRENANSQITGVKITKKDAVSMAYDEQYDEDFALGLPGSNKSDVGQGNPYAINFDKALADSLAVPNSIGPAIAKSMLAAKARVRGASLDMTYTPKFLLQDMEARVRAGEVPPKQAGEQIATFMAQQSAKAYNVNGLRLMNLRQPTDWNINLGAMGSDTIDMMDPVKLERYFTANIAAARAAAFRTETPFGMSNIFSEPPIEPKVKK